MFCIMVLMETRKKQSSCVIFIIKLNRTCYTTFYYQGQFRHLQVCLVDKVHKECLVS